ncbi:MAG: biotin-dependent carboxyltransferase family protein [Natronomonas sp.]|uniref:5-oxoprolinase subunit C family protein n=1 Tax=Natronomonas sp. TaxID=2184060 RepID=UPI0028707315|nr:biotin-dependent carboxyltransferase family protein [Natronomonas sp.]MDR9381075.1 biotin-dependent carboxyltransferase family protein [Natronomonas sp.]MDR9430825.1 biotin-dependent carboxyltransferase family protein [Natronomonas sp.]
MIQVLEPGLSTTVQDTGRYGHYHIGMPPSGAMDQYAHKVANFLVGNDETAATLEMTYAGPEFKFNEDAVVAATGADMEPKLNGEPVPMWSAVQVEAGDILSFEFATAGVRSYLSVAGGIGVPSIMESQSTYTLIGIGGYEGRALQEGDELPVGDATEGATIGAFVDDDAVPDYANNDTIRIVMGLCDYRLTEDGRDEFLDAEWKVSDEADRIGYRLKGPDIEPMFEEREQPFGAGPDPTNVVDLGYPVGSIQMAGQPIVLMQDAVTGGGYATVGTVISIDRNMLAQARTHQNITFQAVDIDEAMEARSRHYEQLDAIRQALLD